MKKVNIKDTGKHGWFVGCFPEAAYQTDQAEVCYVTEPPGEIKAHYHTKCTEIILIINGKAKLHNQIFQNGDIFVLKPGEINDTEYLVPTTIISIKTPAGGHDKVLVDRNTI